MSRAFPINGNGLGPGGKGRDLYTLDEDALFRHSKRTSATRGSKRNTIRDISRDGMDSTAGHLYMCADSISHTPVQKARIAFQACPYCTSGPLNSTAHAHIAVLQLARRRHLIVLPVH